MIALTIAALLATAPLADPANIPAVQQAPSEIAPVDLDDVVVVGRPLDALIDSFVAEVAAPNPRRGIARWADGVCVGVANLKGGPAQYIVDRVSTIAADIGIQTGAPGCSPNILIVASDAPASFVADMVRDSRRTFRVGGSGMDRGNVALRDFATSQEPVRWWQVSIPIDSHTGDRAIRIPGDCRNACGNNYDYAPIISVFAASRLNTQIVDSLIRTIVVIDVNKVEAVSAQQLADYVAMVSLAQINPEADTSAYASILNVFDDPETATSLTNWDIAYLSGLYSAQRTRKELRTGRREIADSIRRAHRDLRSESGDQ